VTALSALLAAVDAPQIAAGETALTAEASTCLIALIPHRALGGISIVVWLFEDRAEVTWADVEGLGRSPVVQYGPRTRDQGRTKDQGPGTDQELRAKNQGPS